MSRRIIEVVGTPQNLDISDDTLLLWVNMAMHNGNKVGDEIFFRLDDGKELKIGKLGGVYLHDGDHSKYCGRVEEIIRQ